MELGFNPREERFRADVVAFFERHVTADVRRELAQRRDEYVPSFHARLAAEGWIGLQWPEAYGGRGLGHIEAAIFLEEAARRGAPLLASYLSSVIGNTMIELGSDELKHRFLPPTIAGDIVYCLGYSESEAGSDLASLRARADRVEGGFRIFGAKMFTSLAHVAQFMVCAARTDPDAPNHRGLTVFLVPMDGVKVDPIWTLGGFRTNATFLDGVFVPEENILGEIHGGWRVLMMALDYERAGTSRIGQAKRLLSFAAAAADAGDAVALETLGRLEAEVVAAELLAYQVAWMQSRGHAPTKEASLAKIAGTELVQRVADAGTRLIGTTALLARGANGAAFEGELEEEYRNTVRFTVTAGTNEIQRNIVAQRGLALPRE